MAIKDNTSHQAPPQVYNWRVYALAISAAMGSAMFGYDSAFIGGTMSLPSFQSRFGLAEASGDTLAALRANIVSTFQAGCFFGVIFVYMATEKVGRRWPLIVCGLIFNIGAVLQVASNGLLGLIYAGRALTGLAVGASSMIIPIYISEASPPAIRGKLIGVFEIFLQFAQIFGFWVNYGVNIHISATDDAQWHIPFALQFIPGGLLSICMWFQPESPRWLLNANRIEQARTVLQRLRQLPADDDYLNWEINTVLQQIEQERALGAHMSFVAKVKEIFTVPANRKRLILGICLMFIQNMSGINALNYYSPAIFQAIGFTGTSVGLLATGVFGIVKAGATAVFMIWGIERIGRRNALLIGSAGAMTALLYIGGFAKVTGSFDGATTDAGGQSPGAYVAIVMVYVFAVFYAMSWNGIPWIFCAEVFPMAIRSACMLFTTCAQWLGQFTIVYSTPYMMANIKWGTFFLFGFSVLFGIIFSFMLIPETKGLSLEDMDILFNQKGFAFTWRKKTDQIIQDRTEAGTDDHIAAEKRNASHVESSA
ncbi:MFS quinate transporter QutD [Sarocladium strictum]